MEIVGLLVDVVSGAVGGNLAGLAWREKSLGIWGNTIVGIIGGAIGTYFMHQADILSYLTMDTLSVPSILGAIGVSAFFGAVLTGIVGVIKGAMKSS